LCGCYKKLETEQGTKKQSFFHACEDR
jgi:hypothetical protein